MTRRKQVLLKRHRRNKRLVLLLALLLLALSSLLAVWLPPLLLVLGWVAHEAWFADHLFYAPGDDYRYDFPEDCLSIPAHIEGGRLHVEAALQGYDTVLLELRLTATWLGRWLDPYVRLGSDRQDFERGVAGRRYLNLSGLPVADLAIAPRFCRIEGALRVHAMRNPDFAEQRLLIIAPMPTMPSWPLSASTAVARRRPSSRSPRARSKPKPISAWGWIGRQQHV